MQPDQQVLSRNSGILLMAGAIVLFGFFLVRPVTADPLDVEANLQTFAENATQFQVHALGAMAGTLLLLGGLVGLGQVLRSDGPALWATLGLVAAVVATPIIMLGPLFDGIVMPAIANVYVQTPDAEAGSALYWAESFVLLSDAMVIPMFIMLGVTLLLFGLALTEIEDYPRWLGWLAVVNGVLGLVVAGGLALSGLVISGIFLALMFLFMIVMTAWLILAGLYTWRRSGLAAKQPQPVKIA